MEKTLDYTYNIGTDKPDVSPSIYENWQGIVDSIATIADVSASLVMHAHTDKIKVASC